MHLLYDENGNPLPHGNGEHHHSHGNGEHHHSHGSGEHHHSHGSGEHHHSHGSGEHHHHHEGGAQKDRTLALLSYLYDHNVHHAEELAGLAKQLEEEGRKEAAQKIKETVAYYEKGNAVFHEALHMLEGISV